MTSLRSLALAVLLAPVPAGLALADTALLWPAMSHDGMDGEALWSENCAGCHSGMEPIQAMGSEDLETFEGKLEGHPEVGGAVAGLDADAIMSIHDYLSSAAES